MPKLSPMRSRELLRILHKLGFIQTHQTGSHLRLWHPDGRRTTVPVHSGEKIGIGLLKTILKQVNISTKDFIKIRK